MFRSKIRVFVIAFFLSVFATTIASAQYAGGTGTELDPYQVSTADHLNNVRDNLTSYFIQTADIDLSSYAEWTPIGTTFTGSYDGDGYAISNLTLGNGSNIGLFSQLGSGGVLKNIVVSDATLTNSTRNGQNIAILVGDTGGTITDCIVFGEISFTGYHSDYIGGLAGYSTSGAISGSSFIGSITAGATDVENVGGLISYMDGGSINNSYVYLTLNTVNYIFQYVGGLVGYANNVTISNSFVVSNELLGQFHTNAVIGIASGGTRTNVFYNEETSGMSDGFQTTGLTSAEMKQQSSFSGWDFSTVWAISDGATFPYLPGTDYRAGGPEISGSEDWHLYGSPFVSSTFATLTDDLWTQGFTGADDDTGTPNLVIWDESAQNWSTPSTLTASLSAGQGFLLHVYEDDDPGIGGIQGGFPKTILVRDEVNTLPQTVNVSYTNGADSNYDGFNLAANPSASTIDWEQVTRNNVTDTYYVWDPAGGHYDTYQSGVGGTNGGSQYIAPFQGFWVRASGSSASLTVDSTDVASTDGTLYKQSPPVSSVLLHLENDEGRSDEVRLVVRDQAVEDDNELYDAPKLAPLSERYLSLAVLADSLSLAIDSRPKAQALNYDLSLEAVNTSGKTVLSLRENHLPDDWTVEWVNTSTGERYNLLEESVSLEIAQRQFKPSGALNHPMMAVEAASSSWQVQITTAATDQEQNTLPAEFALAQNYPNPFNPSTVISYQLPVRSEVHLAVYDLLGRRVAELVNGQIAAGRHTVNFDASNLSSGIYLYRLQAGSSIMTKKLTVVK